MANPQVTTDIRREMRRILCPVDFSEFSASVLAYAAAFAKLRIAQERAIDLIVMGVRGRGPVDMALFGSTTNHVVRRATCPVVTVCARGEQS